MACDLPFGIACIYFEMRGYERALHYFRLSVIQYGHFTGTYFNIALCCYALGDLPHAVAFLREALAAEPENAKFQLQLVRWTQSMASSPQPLEFAAHPAEN
jgi:tetratricopeptide (TPR) repeat protein